MRVADMHDPVWALYDRVVARTGPLSTLIEWDSAVPEFSVLVEEAAAADRLMRRLVAPIGIGALAAVPPDGLPGTRLVLHPSATVLASHHPAVSLWAEATGREEQSGLDLRRPETALVSRPGVQVRRIDTATAGFLTGLGRRMPLGTAVEHAAGGGEFDVSAQIASLFARGLVVRVDSSQAFEAGGEP